MKYTLSCASALLMLAMGLPAQAQFAKPEDAIKYRKASFTVMAAHFGRLGAMPMDVRLTMPKQPQTTRTWSPRCPSCHGLRLVKAQTKVTLVRSQKFGKKLPSTKKQLTRCKPKS